MLISLIGHNVSENKANGRNGIKNEGVAQNGHI